MQLLLGKLIYYSALLQSILITLHYIRTIIIQDSEGYICNEIQSKRNLYYSINQQVHILQIHTQILCSHEVKGKINESTDGRINGGIVNILPSFYFLCSFQEPGVRVMIASRRSALVWLLGELKQFAYDLIQLSLKYWVCRQNNRFLMTQDSYKFGQFLAKQRSYTKSVEMPKKAATKKVEVKATKGKKRKVVEKDDEEKIVVMKKTKAKSKKVIEKAPAKSKKIEEKKKPSKKGKAEEKSKDAPKKVDPPAASDDDKKQEDKKIVTGIKKGKAMVDAKVPNGSTYHVYEEGGKVYAASLMWSDLKNNNNKYYIVQILQSDANATQFMVWNRWGRVGHDGQFAQFRFGTAENAKNMYMKKYNEKTSKGYTEIEISYEDDGAEEPKETKKVKTGEKEIDSTLDKKVQDLIKLIFNMKMMQKQMVEIGYDAKKMPLGKLSKDTIKKGYEVLKKISDVLDGKVKGDLYDLSSEFFTVIPHDFGFKKMSQFVINTKQRLKEKLDMVQALGDIEIATRLLEETGRSGIAEVDNNYEKLKCKIVALEENSEDYKLIDKYIKTTHAATHSSYTLELESAYKINREGEDKRYKKDLGNEMLLWHGSRLTNFAGILSQGLRIAPPEAPATGYMFGKGVYFADMVSKSANYCFASNSDNTGLLLLCRVALGNPRKLYRADFNANNLPQGSHSTMGVGQTGPGKNTAVKFRNMVVPIGPGVPTNEMGCSLLYNEFIVYDVTQVKIEYLVNLKFKYKGHFGQIFDRFIVSIYYYYAVFIYTYLMKLKSMHRTRIALCSQLQLEQLIGKESKKVSVLGVEPRFSEPQSEVLTTRRYRQVTIMPFFNYISFIYYLLFPVFSNSVRLSFYSSLRVPVYLFIILSASIGFYYQLNLQGPNASADLLPFSLVAQPNSISFGNTSIILFLQGCFSIYITFHVHPLSSRQPSQPQAFATLLMLLYPSLSCMLLSQPVCIDAQ
eukprot:TRINITY_DN480_c0_g1_i2.p1 TRINITY_DN480_c0_g1~~TRINITY_DN480_c0_g1_i2.p1  ORF type:complete len:963 (-),score=64.22 TRINITY_DN480_c0_g1_i2:10195-13083(-)